MDTALTHNKLNRLSYFIVAHILILLGYSAHNGLFVYQSQLWLLVAGWVVLLLPLLKNNWLNFNFNPKPLNLLLIANLISFILFYFFDGGIYLSSTQAYFNIELLKFIALSLFLLYFVKFNFKRSNFFTEVFLHFKKRKFIYLILLAIIMRLAIIFYSPTPKMDVFWVLNDGAQSIMAGDNPYSQDFHNPYSPADCLKIYYDSECTNSIYSYLPATIIFSTASKVLFGDVRIVYIFFILGCSAIIYSLTKRKFKQWPRISELAALLILYLPLGLFVVEQAWADQLTLFLLYLFVFLYIRGHVWLAYTVFGLMISAKQLSMAFFIFLTRFKDIKPKNFLFIVVIFISILAPFMIWNFNAFIQDTVLFHLSYDPPTYSLSLSTLFKLYFLTKIPFWASVFLAVVLLAFLLVKTKRDLSGIIHSALLLLLALVLLKQGFANYYHSISGGIILLIALELNRFDLLEHKR